MEVWLLFLKAAPHRSCVNPHNVAFRLRWLPITVCNARSKPRHADAPAKFYDRMINPPAAILQRPITPTTLGRQHVIATGVDWSYHSRNGVSQHLHAIYQRRCGGQHVLRDWAGPRNLAETLHQHTHHLYHDGISVFNSSGCVSVLFSHCPCLLSDTMFTSDLLLFFSISILAFATAIEIIFKPHIFQTCQVPTILTMLCYCSS
jgi:hypothetical protein